MTPIVSFTLYFMVYLFLCFFPISLIFARRADNDGSFAMSREEQHAYLSNVLPAIPTFPFHRRRRSETRSALLFSMFLTILLLVQSLSAWSAPVALAATNGLKPLHLPNGTQTFKQFVKEGQQRRTLPLRLPNTTMPAPPPGPRNPSSLA
jgi:hypothetical protein